jgi:predicted TIM-barrel fold metal-dependent hydrolase
LIADVNVSLSRWPFRRLPGDEPAALVRKLRASNVTQAWAGSFDGVFHKDVAGANARLAAQCREFGAGLLLPFGTVNPQLPDWREDLRRCHEQHKMPGIRLHPNYHSYKLGDSVFRELLRLAAARDLVVQIAMCMEDERTQHPLMRVPPVEIGPLADAIAAEPQIKMVILNCYPQLPIERLRPLSSAGRVYFDLSMVERVGAIVRFGAQVSMDRILFGSHFPFFNLESALLKVEEAGLTESQRVPVLAGNARRLLGR